jgi:hypothetical protein
LPEIPYKGVVVLVDECDVSLFESRNWTVMRKRDLRHLRHKRTFFHRAILQPPAGMVVDHINGNGLDNRRSNLRVCTHAENLRNRPPHKGSASRFKGISRHRNKWQAYVSMEKKHYYLGLFETEESAAREYDRWAIKLHGPFARLNFPEKT